MNDIQRRRLWLGPTVAFIMFIMYVLFYMPTPYLVFKPGSAESVKPMVQIKAGDPAEAGAFMLTTVSMTYANAFTLVRASLDPYAEYSRRRDYFGEESKQEYDSRQQYNMLSSQSNAIQAAYHKAEIPYSIQTESIVVLRVESGAPAEGKLQPGDQIKQVDGKNIAESGDLAQNVRSKKAGETVAVTFHRKGKQHRTEITTAQLKSGSGETYTGIGVAFVNMQAVRADNPDQDITIHAGDIGGPSAGLMFSLEMYNQLTPGDLSKGYRIAGTGTITPDGQVGRIGGIHHKVVAADREKADLFFAPKDNYADAAARAKKLDTAMKVVPVETLDDALEYLAQLPPRSSAESGR